MSFRLKQPFVTFLCCGNFLALAATCHAQYTFQTIDFPGAKETVVYGINQQGTIVGQYGDIDFSGPFNEGNRGFVYDGEQFETIHVPGSLSTNARGINDQGMIVGGYATRDGQTRGFIFDGQEYRDVVTPFAEQSSALDLNNRGEIVGVYSGDGFQQDIHGFFFDGNEYESFDITGADRTEILGINDSGTRVGFSSFENMAAGFLLTGDDSQTIRATSLTHVTGLNNEGEVVGYFLAGRSVQEAWYQSFLYDSRTSEFVNPNITLPGPDCTFSLLDPPLRCLKSVHGINSAGTIVGSYDNDDGTFHGYIGAFGEPPELRAGDADQDLDFDQLDLVQVQVAARYLTGQDATWGEGDWDGAPGGSVGSPPEGDGVFDQDDIVAALQAGVYLTGPYTARSTVKAFTEETHVEDNHKQSSIEWIVPTLIFRRDFIDPTEVTNIRPAELLIAVPEPNAALSTALAITLLFCRRLRRKH